MPRNYDLFSIDADIPGEICLRIRKTIDAILDGGYDISDREHLAFLISMDMQVMYYRGKTLGVLESGDRWTKLLTTRTRERGK